MHKIQIYIFGFTKTIVSSFPTQKPPFAMLVNDLNAFERGVIGGLFYCGRVSIADAATSWLCMLSRYLLVDHLFSDRSRVAHRRDQCLTNFFWLLKEDSIVQQWRYKCCPELNCLTNSLFYSNLNLHLFACTGCQIFEQVVKMVPVRHFRWASIYLSRMKMKHGT